ncbi:MAG: serine/threonine-protein kinase, partial [Longimicrobiales bacterium]
GREGAQGRTSSLQLGGILAGRYRILEHLGDGAMGSVYLGEHLRIGRKDAIKVLRDSLSSDTEAMARFVRGARSVSRIRHENVCTIYDFSDTPEGVQFLAMEYIPGITLKDLLAREGTLPLERVVSITVQAAGALQAAHDAGIVHRDLKPANIMLMPARDGADIVKVVDFDIAKAEDDGGETEVTRFGFVVGTPEYMSPEQLTGEALDGRSDVYSLALVVYRMLTGLLPFAVENTREMLIGRLTRTPLTLEQVLPGRSFPRALQQVLDWALQRNARDRAPSTAAFAQALIDTVGSRVPGQPSSVPIAPARSQQPSIDPARLEIPPTRIIDASPATGFERSPRTRWRAQDHKLLLGS